MTTLQALEEEVQRRGLLATQTAPDLQGVPVQPISTLQALETEVQRRGLATPTAPVVAPVEPAAPVVAPVEPITSPGGVVSGVLEPAAAIGSAIVAEPVAGLAGIGAAIAGGPEAGAEAVQRTQEALTFQPKTATGQSAIQAIGETLQPLADVFEEAQTTAGDIGFQIAGPLGGAIGATLPTAALEALGLIGVKKAATVAPINKRATATAAVNSVEDVEGIEKNIFENRPKTEAGAQVGEIKVGTVPEAQDYEQILNNLAKRREKAAAEQVLPDEVILEAAADLNVDLNPSHYSTNRAFIDVEQSLKSRPGSKLGAIEEKAIRDLGERADSLIEDLGGSTDKSLLDANIKNDINTATGDLQNQSNKLYETVENAIPKSTIVDPTSSRSYVEETLNDLGGNEKLLSLAEKKLLDIKDDNPTYFALDRIRKDVGEALRKKSGPYATDESGTLKRVYRVLSEDQQGVAEAFNVGSEYAAARKFVQSRKDLEKQSVELFGREINGSIIPKLKTAATSLTSGDISRFRRLMNALPKERRQEAAATMLNNLFTLGARRQDAIGQGFVNAFKGLNRNKEAKDLLFKNLPPGARARFDKIGSVATGIFRSKELENTSKTARDIISAMEEGGMFKKMFTTGSKIATAEGISTTLGFPGAGTAGVVGTTLAKRKSKATDAAEEFLTSKKFSDAVKTAADGNPVGAQNILNKSPSYRKWLRSMNKEDAAKIATVGFIPWVTGQTEER